NAVVGPVLRTGLGEGERSRLKPGRETQAGSESQPHPEHARLSSRRIQALDLDPLAAHTGDDQADDLVALFHHLDMGARGGRIAGRGDGTMRLTLRARRAGESQRRPERFDSERLLT